MLKQIKIYLVIWFQLLMKGRRDSTALVICGFFVWLFVGDVQWEERQGGRKEEGGETAARQAGRQAGRTEQLKEDSRVVPRVVVITCGRERKATERSNELVFFF